MRVSVLSKGGMAVYGGHYDPHRNEACFDVRDGEGVAVTVEFPSAPTTPTIAVSGVTSSALTTSGAKVSFTLTAIDDCGYADLTAVVGGVDRVVRLRARSPSPLDRYED